MTSAAQKILAAALELPDDERAQLAEKLMQSIDGGDEESVPLADAHREELDRRLDAFKQEPSAGSSWEEVRARLQAHR